MIGLNSLLHPSPAISLKSFQIHPRCVNHILLYIKIHSNTCRSFPDYWFRLCFLLPFSYDRSKCTSPSFSSNKLQIFSDTSDLLSEMSNFQHHTFLRSQSSILLDFFLKFKPNSLVRRPSYLLNAAFAMTILDLTSRVHLGSLLSGYPNI
jgi:hypothetical protein